MHVSLLHCVCLSFGIAPGWVSLQTCCVSTLTFQCSGLCHLVCQSHCLSSQHCCAASIPTQACRAPAQPQHVRTATACSSALHPLLVAPLCVCQHPRAFNCAAGGSAAGGVGRPAAHDRPRECGPWRPEHARPERPWRHHAHGALASFLTIRTQCARAFIQSLRRRPPCACCDRWFPLPRLYFLPARKRCPLIACMSALLASPSASTTSGHHAGRPRRLRLCRPARHRCGAPSRAELQQHDAQFVRQHSLSQTCGWHCCTSSTLLCVR